MQSLFPSQTFHTGIHMSIEEHLKFPKAAQSEKLENQRFTLCNLRVSKPLNQKSLSECVLNMTLQSHWK